MLVRDAGCNDADFVVLCVFHAVIGTGIAVRFHFRKQLFADEVTFSCGCGKHREFVNLPFIGLYGNRRTDALLNQPFGMAYACCHAQHYGDVEAFAQFKCRNGEILAFLRIGRLHHSKLCVGSVQTVVLFVLGAVAAGVICGNDYHATVYACIAHCENRVSRNVHADVLHCAESACAADGCACCNLCCNLLICCPFAVDVVLVKLTDVFQNFCAGCAGVSCRNVTAGFVDAACDSFVAAHDYFVHHR